MKKYLRHKEFIPIDFVEKRNLKDIKGSKKGYEILIFLNILLFIFNLKNVFSKDENIDLQPEPQKKYIEKEEIFRWINLYDKSIINFQVHNDIGEITYSKDRDLKYLEALGVKIKKVTNYDEDKVVKVMYD